eukprot:TRINITY_DN6521_c1_g1_i1.p1 TRINITY_DN6521_c1_g1~~TRINITY_DN6521_c1_g1_i1.p1  ORF type:complete len:565 (+),score=173.52 TRINITY_DN6521_c1_g1_i1:82-1695(+)
MDGRGGGMSLVVAHSGGVHQVSVPLTEEFTISDLKQMIAQETGVSAAAQNLNLPAGAQDRTPVMTVLADGDVINLTEEAPAASGRHEDPEVIDVAPEALVEPVGAPGMQPMGPMGMGMGPMQGGGPLQGMLAGMSNMLSGIVGGTQFGAGAPVEHAMMQQFAGSDFGAGGEVVAGLRRVARDAAAAANVPITAEEVEGTGTDPKRQRVDEGLGQWLVKTVHELVAKTTPPAFTDALAAARREPRLLAVLLYSSAQRRSIQLFSELSHPENEVQQILAHNFIVWMCDTVDPQFREFLRVLENNPELRSGLATALGPAASDPELPLLAVIAPQGASVRVVACAQGDHALSPMLCFQRLTMAVSDHEPELAKIRSSRSEVSAAMNLQREQDAAYNEAAELDRIMEMSRREEEERQRQAAEEAAAEAAAAARQEEELKQSLERKREERAAALQPEPAEGARVLFRMPSGERIQRRFDPQSRVSELWNYMASVDAFQQLADDTDSITLVTSYPKKSFTIAEDGERTLAEAGFSRDAAFFVQV